MTTPGPADANPAQRLQEALRTCDSEPIHRPGVIQPVGVLLALDEQLCVVHASENIGTLFPGEPATLLHRPFAQLVGEAQAQKVRTLAGMGEWRPSAVTSFSLTHNGAEALFDAQVSYLNGLWLVEIEAQPRSGDDLFQQLFIPIRDALWQLDAEQDLRRYTQQVVDQVRLLTGYDRVMMYRFDANWDGEVIAESKEAAVGSYLGNRFPASDIPAQARLLYTRNLVRLIADVEAAPVPILPPLTAATGAPLDLTYSALRHFSPVHLEYLRNMGVRASLSISLLQNGRLWGLIACHHFSPKYISLRVRELDEFIGKTVSLKLSNFESERRTAFQAQVRALLQHLTEEVRTSRDVEAVIHAMQPQLLGLVRANGALIAIGGKHFHLGETPDPAQVTELEQWLRARVTQPVFQTDDLAALFPGALPYRERISGLMLAALDPRMENYIAWFRSGLVRTVKWAGNPDKRIHERDGRLRISPRESFATWIQTYRDKSPPWSPIETDAANALAMAVIEVLTHRALELSEENYRLLAEYSTDMIARFDSRGVYTFVSQASLRLLGYEAAQLIGTPVAAHVHPEDGEKLQHATRSLLQSGETPNIIVRMQTGRATTLWVECSFRRMTGRGGETEIVMNARDVTQRHTYQLAIEDLHRRNSRILEAAGDGVISLDPQGRITYANERAANILGYPARAMVGASCCELIRPRNPAGQLYTAEQCPLLGAVLRNEPAQGAREYFTHRDGHAIPVEYICNPMSEDGKLSGCVLVFNEHAERHRLNEELQTSDAIIDQAAEAVMVTDSTGRIVSVNRAFTEVTGYGRDEACGQTPRLLKSGVHTAQFYESLWEALRREHRWSGELWNRRKNGEIYAQWGTITAILNPDGQARNYVAVFSDISKAKQAEEKLFFFANHDPLTGLPNRVRFVEQLAQALERAHRSGQRIGVAFVDIDRFKIINDTLGHGAGDQFLKAIARRLSAAMQRQALLSRWGGDEFTLFVEGIGEMDALSAWVREVVDTARRPLTIDGHELAPTISVGVAVYPQDADNAGDLIKAADSAMYRAKERGRDGYEFYTESLAAESRLKFQIVNELGRALRHNELLLHYQPQVDAASGRIVGLEALVRWQHPQRGLLPPGQFIPLSEELGLISQVGEWVLQEACRQAAEWSRSQMPCPRIAINIAPRQLKAALVESVERTLARHCLPASALELEITEGALEQGEKVREVLDALRNLGVGLSIDDFGTGYSSLAHLKRLPIDCFKIDKSFIDGIPGNAQDVAIIRTILALGTSLAVRVVAEGVETREQYEFLKSVGHMTVQGFYFSRPLPAERIPALLAHSDWH